MRNGMLLKFNRNILVQPVVLIIFSMSFSLGIMHCTRQKTLYESEESGASISLAVFSDPHYYDPDLGITGDNFYEITSSDRKMIAESQAIMEETIRMISDENVEVVLVAGDLTKDGEKQCHEKVAVYLAQLEASGKKVYVVPGNHDIDNPNAYGYPYSGDPVFVGSITPAEFEEIYHDFGYGEAIARDSTSLTYIAQPKDGIWILAIDACNYNNKYPDISRVGGKISNLTMNWIKGKLQEAHAENVTVLGLIHHGLLEHFPGEALLFEDYVINDWKIVSEELAESGLRLVFSGHFHASDIARSFSEHRYLIDIQTGSTVTWPCPYRVIDLNRSDQVVNLHSNYITQILYDTGGKDFQTYARETLINGMSPLIETRLIEAGLEEVTAQTMAPFVTTIIVANAFGDEPIHRDPALMASIDSFKQESDVMVQFLGMIMEGIMNDETPDNHVEIILKNGKIKLDSEFQNIAGLLNHQVNSSGD